MRKIKGILVIGLLSLGLLGCTPYELRFDGQNRSTGDIEEIIEDQLELENPDLDLEVIIELDDDKKKKKKSK